MGILFAPSIANLLHLNRGSCAIFIFILGTGSLKFIVVLTLSALGFWNNSAQTILYLKFLVALIVLRVRLLPELPVLGNNLGLSCANLRYQHSGVGIVQTQ